MSSTVNMSDERSEGESSPISVLLSPHFHWILKVSTDAGTLGLKVTVFPVSLVSSTA